ncbi:MAG TPA: hypothetical protein VD839_10700 [Burkholderiales bacterium]|nr:hypothetical protein [Burkholderiales bacterium]
MVGAFRVGRSEWLTSAFHLVILIVAFQDDSGRLWPFALALVAIVSFVAWVLAYRRYRQIHDLPTSKVASAAQGYVELFGRSERLAGEPLVSKLSGLPCCWFRYYIEQKESNDKWKEIDSGVSVAHFLLVDDTGRCVISPEGAEVLCSRKQVWTEGVYRYTEWLLLEQGPLYAIGEFVTHGGGGAELDEKADLTALLSEWKQDQAVLHGRFDLNRDGAIDLKEWELARLQARREVRQKHTEIRVRDGVHLLRKPRDGRLFLLANEMPDKLGRRFAFWSAVHLIIFLGAGTASLFVF